MHGAFFLEELSIVIYDYAFFLMAFLMSNDNQID